MRSRRTNESQSYAATTAVALGWVALLALAIGVPAGAADRIALGALFDDNSQVVAPQKAAELAATLRSADAPEPCALGALVIVTPVGDELYQEVLARVRRDSVLIELGRQGIDTGRVFIDSKVEGTRDDAWLDLRLDREKPQLETTSDPPRGHLVHAGDLIRVTITARDDAEPMRWQTGIKTIRLVADSEDGSTVANEDYEACAGRLLNVEGNLADVLPPPRTLEATYVVPDLVPSRVRLAAIAWDHADLQDDIEMLEFPTGSSDIWLDASAGVKVRIVQAGDRVTATYLEPRECDHKNDTGVKPTSDFDFSGTIQGNLISGELGTCKFGVPDAGWVRSKLELEVDENRNVLSGKWYHQIQRTWVPIRFERLPLELGRPVDVVEE